MRSSVHTRVNTKLFKAERYSKSTMRLKPIFKVVNVVKCIEIIQERKQSITQITINEPFLQFIIVHTCPNYTAVMYKG